MSYALVKIPKDTTLAKIDKIDKAEAMVAYSKHLSVRETKQIVTGFESESYEMVTSFVWTRATSVLRNELAKLGMEFIGELLNRPDLNDDSPSNLISESEAIGLAENLGMVSPTEAMRLRQVQALVGHFNNPDFQSTAEDDVVMTREEAITSLRACVKNILAVPSLQLANEYATFRSSLETTALKVDDDRVAALLTAPYFFRKTTLSFLLSSIRNSDGAQLVHALNNINLLLPLLWSDLKKSEKWQIGQTYAELYANGMQTPVAGLKKALLSVHGFDFVPETTRSATFTKCAQKVLEAHEGYNNFHTEGPAMQELESLGTVIPMPAFAVCMKAILMVFLGNEYGNSWTGAATALTLCKAASPDRWEYYLSDCLPSDKDVLYKLTRAKPTNRFRNLVRECELDGITVKNSPVRKIISAAKRGEETIVNIVAAKLMGTVA